MTKTDLLQERLHPLGEWVLCRQVERKSNILRINGDALPTYTHAEVVSHGPGEYQSGVFVKVAECLKPGTIVVVPGNHCIQFPDWKEERLFTCPASSIIATLDASIRDEFESSVVVPQRIST